MLSDRCLSVLSVLSVCLSVCDVGVLWRNGWMEQDETWHEGRPRPRPHCVRWGPSPPPKRAQPPLFGHVLWPNGWTDQHATWYGCRFRPLPHCVRYGPSCLTKRGTAQPSIFGLCLLGPHAVANLDYCWALVMVALWNRADHYIFILFLLSFLWSPYVIGQTIIFSSCSFFLSSIYLFFSSPNLSGRKLDVYHTLAHGATLVRI